MNFLKKIQSYLVGASENVNEFNTHIETEKEKYDTKSTRKAILVSIGVLVVVIAILYFVF